MELTPVIANHLAAALGAVATEPVALWERLGARQCPSTRPEPDGRVF